MAAINVHCTRATDTLTAGATERERWVDLILDFDQSVKEHWTASLEVDVVGNILRSIIGITWVRSVDVKPLHLLLLLRCQTLVELFSVVCLEYVTHLSKGWRLVTLRDRCTFGSKHTEIVCDQWAAAQLDEIA